MTPVRLPTLQELRRGGKRLLARTLAAVETEEGTDALADLLDRACDAPLGHVLGLTGPPGVGKSTLAGRLVADMRGRGYLEAGKTRSNTLLKRG